jgi:low temperature requirement protein LtrA
MIAGTIVTAAADEKILSDPASHASAASATIILAGPALFVAGHAAFTYFIWRRISWSRVTGIAVLATLAATTRTPPWQPASAPWSSPSRSWTRWLSHT